MHDVATKDYGALRRSHNDAHVAWRVSGPRLDPYAVIEGIVAGHQLRPAALHDWQQAVLVIPIGRVSGAQFGALPVFPFLPREEIAGIGKRRHPSAIDEPRVTANVIGVKMRAKDEVDVLGLKARGCNVGKIGPILSMVALLVWALLVIARAGVDEDGRAWRPYHRAVKRKDHQAAFRVQQRRLKPTSVTFEDLRCYVWMNDSRL